MHGSRRPEDRHGHQHDANRDEPSASKRGSEVISARTQPKEGEDEADHRRDVLDEYGQDGCVLRLEQSVPEVVEAARLELAHGDER